MFFVYILYSTSANKYYVGHTNDVPRRLEEHNDTSENSFTSKHRPWVLKASFEVTDDRGTALKVERFIKKQKSRWFIEELIQNNSIDFIIEKFL